MAVLVLDVRDVIKAAEAGIADARNECAKYLREKRHLFYNKRKVSHDLTSDQIEALKGRALHVVFEAFDYVNSKIEPLKPEGKKWCGLLTAVNHVKAKEDSSPSKDEIFRDYLKQEFFTILGNADISREFSDSFRHKDFELYIDCSNGTSEGLLAYHLCKDLVNTTIDDCVERIRLSGRFRMEGSKPEIFALGNCDYYNAIMEIIEDYKQFEIYKKASAVHMDTDSSEFKMIRDYL